MRIRSDWRKRLEKAVKDAGGNRAALSKKAKLNATYIRDVLDRGQCPNPENAQKLSDGLGIPINDWFIEDAPSRVSTNDGFTPIGRFDASFSMGPGALVADRPEPLGHWLVETQWLHAITRSAPDSLAIVRADGDSMAPTLHDGDWVLIDLKMRRLTREGIYAIRVSDDVWIKRLSLNLRTKSIRVISDNTTIPVQDVEEEDLSVIGRVIALVARKL